MGFENDKLNREKYANFLTEIVKNPNKNKRITDSESLTIAIDSGLGTGKTTFINMWKEKLVEKYPTDFAIVGYNAWKNDFVENPFQSIIYSIYNSSIFEQANRTERFKQAGNELLKSGGKLVLSVAKFNAQKFLGKEATDAIIEAFGTCLNEVQTETVSGVKSILSKEKAIDEECQKFYEEYKEYNNAIEKLKENLKIITKETKLIIIIDELDRCKPLFAIKLLENIKHIFDVKNVVFVFALDMEQLSHSIRCVYGQGMDAEGYLCRFFDYITKMPNPDMKAYIDYMIGEKPAIRSKLLDTKKSSYKSFNDVFYDVAENFKLTPRDINTIYSNFIILENQELKNNEIMKAYSLYLVLLSLKYKNNTVFNQIFVHNNYSNMSDNTFSKYKEHKEIFDSNVIDILTTNKKIKDIVWKIKSSRGDYINGKILRKESCWIVYVANTLSPEKKRIDCDENISLSDLLFYDDVSKWESIKEKRIGDYIQEKLEFFNFEFESKKTKEDSDNLISV